MDQSSNACCEIVTLAYVLRSSRTRPRACPFISVGNPSLSAADLLCIRRLRWVPDRTSIRYVRLLQLCHRSGKLATIDGQLLPVSIGLELAHMRAILLQIPFRMSQNCFPSTSCTCVVSKAGVSWRLSLHAVLPSFAFVALDGLRDEGWPVDAALVMSMHDPFKRVSVAKIMPMLIFTFELSTAYTLHDRQTDLVGLDETQEEIERADPKYRTFLGGKPQSPPFFESPLPRH